MTRTILILAANPKDTSRLRLDQEVREIDNGLQRAPNRREFILKQQWATRPKDVRRAMLNFSNRSGAGLPSANFKQISNVPLTLF